MKYKVGDKVLIKSLDWYNKNKTKHGDIWFDNAVFTGGQSLYCGCELTIRLVTNDRYYVNENDYYWTDDMIECKIEKETKFEPKFKVGDILFYRGETCGYLKVEEIRKENGEIRYYENSRNIYLIENDPDVFADKVCSVETEETKSEDELLDDYEELTDRAFKGGYEKCKSDIELNGLQLPEGYQFVDEGGNVINTTKIVLEKKKKEYPTTIEECCKILGLEFNPFYTGVKRQVNYKDGLLHNLKCLLIYRDAYWKLYGEEMGLGKPWEPDWDDEKQDKYGFYNEVKYTIINSALFVFPTAEMRNAFRENFGSDIEFCKKL